MGQSVAGPHCYSEGVIYRHNEETYCSHGNSYDNACGPRSPGECCEMALGSKGML